MLHDQLPIDDITSPLSAQIFDLCDNQQLFQHSTISDEVTSSSKILEKSRSFQDDNNTDLSTIFDSSHEDFENDIAASIDFSSSSLQYPIIDHLLTTTTTNQDQFDFVNHHQSPNILYSRDPLALPEVSSITHPLGLFEEDCLSSVPSYNLGFINPTSPFHNSGLPTYMENMCTGLVSSNVDNSGLLYPDSINHIFNQEDLQKALGGIENQTQLMVPQTNSVLKPVEITGLEDSTVNKVEKLTVEQRKEKISRYMKKRNERNFIKKIKYACRKTLADSRPRVRGRFAKNDELDKQNREASSSHHDDENNNMGMKNEEQLVNSSDIFAHISGANSFKCNYQIQSWI